MTFKAGLIGGIMGTSVHFGALAISKLPLSRMPWCHVGYFIVGAYVGNFYEREEKRLLDEVNNMRTSTGLPPIIGSQILLPGMMGEKK
eukprot:CAMPEP_0116014340 /NCGR_PEP_ID=MMETSP0321-20121206/6222_1 /TAXON_ID=163516 /ORGANISM="Leptocylindrus danicus var. danicus, Strain B650" /LENGTH=87 /DNA_ID=CAMNT_0003483979 /DNA_START=79 /DNA_END=342 /DNA_ORIENTATION=-